MFCSCTTLCSCILVQSKRNVKSLRYAAFGKALQTYHNQIKTSNKQVGVLSVLTTCSSLISHTNTHKHQQDKLQLQQLKNKYSELRICNHRWTGSNMIMEFVSSATMQLGYEPGTNILIYRTSER